MYRLAASKITISTLQRGFGNATAKNVLTKRVVKQPGQLTVRWAGDHIGGSATKETPMGLAFVGKTMGLLGVMFGGYYALYQSGENASNGSAAPAPGKASPKIPPPETPAPVIPVSEEKSSKEAPEEPAPAIPVETPEKLVPESEPEKPAPKKSEPEKPAPKKSEHEKSAPKQSEPEKSAKKSEPEKSAPPKSEPEEPAPAIPLETPEKLVPEKSEPEKAAVAKSEPDPVDAKEKPATEEPESSEVVADAIPGHVPYVIVGAGTAAMAASRAIRDNDPNAKVLMIGEEDCSPYKRPPLSKQLWFTEDEAAVEALKFKHWNGAEQSIFFENADFFLSPAALLAREEGGVALLQGAKVVDIDVLKRSLRLADGKNITYNKCLIATGGKPRNLPAIANAGPEVAERVTLFRNISDFRRLYSVAKPADKSPRSVAIVGGGFMGSELACALGKQEGVKVTQTFPEPGNMGKVLPAYLSKWATDKVRNEGVTVIPETSVTECRFDQESQQVKLKLNNDQTLSVDHVVVAVGLEPSVELSAAGLEVSDRHGGFLVNAELEARSNVWVAGDAACFYDVRLGRRRVEHHDHAVVSGRLAGNNMASSSPKPYTHQSYFWSDLGPEVGYEAIGLVDSSLPTMAVFAKATAKDTPKAVAEEQASETPTAPAELSKTVAVSTPAPPPGPDEATDDYGKGVVFYMKEKKVVGVLLWNVFKKLPLARQVIADGITEDELVEGPISKAFHLHEE